MSIKDTRSTLRSLLGQDVRFRFLRFALDGDQPRTVVISTHRKGERVGMTTSRFLKEMHSVCGAADAEWVELSIGPYVMWANGKDARAFDTRSDRFVDVEAVMEHYYE